jgi:hypothetical protein
MLLPMNAFASATPVEAVQAHIKTGFIVGTVEASGTVLTIDRF